MCQSAFRLLHDAWLWICSARTINVLHLERVRRATHTPLSIRTMAAPAVAAPVASCIFCSIVAGKIPCIKLTETAHSIAFMDIYPISKGHCLVVPKVHAAKLHEVTDEVIADVAVTMRRVAAAAGAENYNVLQNNGELAHQAVHHVHFHIIPKTSEADGLGFVWPAAAGDKAALQSLADDIKSRL